MVGIPRIQLEPPILQNGVQAAATPDAQKIFYPNQIFIKVMPPASHDLARID
jgi:adenosine deaminase